MTETFHVGCGAGFSGDRTDAAGPVVETLIASGAPSAMIFEVLAERTLGLAQLARRNDAQAGYEPLTEAFVAPILERCVRHGIPIVGNFGAANPSAGGKRILKVATELGLRNVRVAVVEGDDISSRLDEIELEPWPGEPLFRRGNDLIAANVYLGAEPIVEALQQGAHVVVTGRVSDSALVLAPLAHHFRWAVDDWQRLAGGILAGHLLECAAQVTGGYFADPGMKDVAGLEDVGFPIAEVSADGALVLTKAAATGGEVSLRTVKEQILYEMGDPTSYLTPDVVLDVTQVKLEHIASDRVRVSGARGRERPETLKVIYSREGPWLGEGEISYAGPNAAARARLAIEILSSRFKRLGLRAEHRFDIVGSTSLHDSDDGSLRSAQGSMEASDVRLRLSVNAPERQVAERMVREVLSLFTCGPAGGAGVRTHITPRILTGSFLVPRKAVQTTVRMLAS